jgi:hypothetical protein
MPVKRVRVSRGLFVLLLVTVTTSCAGVTVPDPYQTAELDSVRVLVVRTGQDELVGYVPVCPGDKVDIGVAADQAPGTDDEISSVYHRGAFGGVEPEVMEFTLSPATVLAGSLMPDLPLGENSGTFTPPVTDLEHLGGFYVSTSRTYHDVGFDEEPTPQVGQAWVLVGREHLIVDDVASERSGLVASAKCDEPPVG